VTDAPEVAQAARRVLEVVGVVVGAGVVVSLAHRFLTAQRDLRTALGPVLAIAMIGGIA
jgi:hypothetical protein